MERKTPGPLAKFLGRAVTGIVLFLLMNSLFYRWEIPLKVGINPVTVAAAGTLGAPGVVLVYGIVYYSGL